MFEKDRLDEDLLVALLVKGDRDAFSQLYARYSSDLLHRLNKLLPDEEAVLEIHQIAFVRLWEIRERVRIEQGIWSLLHTIARNLVVDYFRKSATNEAVRNALLTQATLYYELDEPTNQVEEMSTLLSATIDRLPAKRKEIFLLCKFQGKSYEEVAQLQGVSIGTVKDHMAKAMRFLKTELGGALFSLFLALVNAWR
ncbi:sigma-70 family RNA polymerase sigma factor [Sphingobacterium psychroaquaticum]|uniref:RNA polymerase sigma-70 factor, ECF subfamily n=1 Tax=Sphingobacterium psychroaquaticum TaxID=561061 RepID=A0A1X7JB00_9SPHI|nr:sigma-70 family RNA polymerase sigma factor [Sphingobacterium psychroaquaticum]SMG24653.1 RNA polymerase sigma-70 factor, ECF subfamily [Sphingobacterium psychroaquaticum]